MTKQTDKEKAKKIGRPRAGESVMEVSLPIRVPRELRDAARAKTKRTGVPASFVLRKRLEEWVNET